jgi:hypothetical protein
MSDAESVDLGAILHGPGTDPAPNKAPSAEGAHRIRSQWQPTLVLRSTAATRAEAAPTAVVGFALPWWRASSNPRPFLGGPGGGAAASGA